MGDAIDRMYESSLWGYAMGQHVYPFFANGVAYYAIAILMAMAFVWRLGFALVEEEDEPMRSVVKWMVGSAVVLMSLFSTVQFPLTEKAPLTPFALDMKKKLYGTDQGRMPWLADKVDNFMDLWIQIAAKISNRDNRFLYVGSVQSAAQNLSKSDSLQDPQTQSIITQWRNVIVPAYLLQNASFAQKVRDEGLMDVLLYPVTTANDIRGEQVVERARRLVQLLTSEPKLDAVGAVRALSAHLNDPANRLAGSAMTLDANGTGIVADMLGPYSRNSTMSPATPPEDLTDKAKKAYAAGYRVLTGVANDSTRQPKTSYANFAEIYQGIGYATDVALAKRQLQSPQDVVAFGITCYNRSDDFCKAAFTVAPTSLKPNEDGIDLGNRLLRFGNAAAKTPGAAVDLAMLQFIKTEVPFYIGAARGLVTAMTPIILIVMLWPGRFAQGMTMILGGYVIVGMWMCFYILWTYLVSDFLLGSDMAGLGQIVGVTSAVGSFPAMVKVLVGGYTVFGMVSFMLVFGGMERLYRHMGMGGGAGVSVARGGVGNMLKSKGQSLTAAGQSAGNAGTAAAGRGLSALGRFVGR